MVVHGKVGRGLLRRGLSGRGVAGQGMGSAAIILIANKASYGDAR